jgi:hypothetical protein
MASTEHIEELIVLQFAYRSGLEFQQGVLAGVHIYGIDMTCACQKVVKGIATCGADDQQTILGAEVQRLAIEPGIFPASVVDEVVAMDKLKNTTTDPFTNWHRLENLSC